MTASLPGLPAAVLAAATAAGSVLAALPRRRAAARLAVLAPGRGSTGALAAGPASERADSDLPLVYDLLALGLRAGLDLAATLRLAAAVTAPGLTDACRAAADGVDDGLAPEAALAPCRAVAGLAPAAEALERTVRTGVATADLLADLARRAREEALTGALTRARTASVAAIAPVTCCFLPAFVLAGIVPAGLGLLGLLRG